MRMLGYVCFVLILIIGCDVVSNQPRPLAKMARLDVHLVTLTETPNSTPENDINSDTPIFLTNPPLLTAADVVTIQQGEHGQQTQSLNVNLTPAGAKKLAAATATPTNGMKLAFVVNGRLVATPKVIAPMSTSYTISGMKAEGDRPELFLELTGK